MCVKSLLLVIHNSFTFMFGVELYIAPIKKSSHRYYSSFNNLTPDPNQPNTAPLAMGHAS